MNPSPPAPVVIRSKPLVEPALSQAWILFRRSWRLLIATLLLASVAAIVGFGTLIAVTMVPLALHGAFATHAPLTPEFVARIALLSAGAFVVGVAAWLWTYAAAFGIADALLTRGSATFADAVLAFRRCWGALLLAAVGAMLIGMVAVLLAIPTLGLALLAFPLVLMYVPSSIVSGGRGGFAAIGESFRLVRRRLGASALAIVVLIAINYAISFLTFPFMLPLQFALATMDPKSPAFPPVSVFVSCAIGLAVISIVGLAYYGYAALVLSGLYREIENPPEAILAVP